MTRIHRHRKMKGGFLEYLTQGAANAWEKAKKATTDAYSSASGYSASSSTYVPPVPTPAPVPASPPVPLNSYAGGRKRSISISRSRSRSRSMRGGYSDNEALTGLAASAAPISDIKSAQPQTIVGGRRTKRHRRYHKHGKSCKRRH